MIPIYNNLHLNLHLIEMLRTALAMLVASVAADDTKCTKAEDCADAGENDTCYVVEWEAEDADGVDADT